MEDKGLFLHGCNATTEPLDAEQSCTVHIDLVTLVHVVHTADLYVALCRPYINLRTPEKQDGWSMVQKRNN